MRLLLRFFSFLRSIVFFFISRDHDIIVRRYLRTGGEFGDAVSYIYMGECVGFEHLLNQWAVWEQKYAALGYRTIPVDDFVDYGWGKPIPGLRVYRQKGEEIVLHAERYRENFLGKYSPVFSLAQLKPGEVLQGTYVVPSTKNSSDEESSGSE